MVLRPFVEEPKGSVANYPYFERGKDSTMAYLYRLFQERIVMFDGAMGTMIQKYRLGEEEYRGERYKVCVALLCRLRYAGFVAANAARRRSKSLGSCVPSLHWRTEQLSYRGWYTGTTAPIIRAHS